MFEWKNKPTFPPGFQYSSFADATTVTPADTDNSLPPNSGIYTADLKRDWCIGFVPHGGYLTALLLKTAHKHITTHPFLAPLNQPHAIHISCTFFNSCTPGAARITITPLKTGRQYTFLRATLTQNGGERLCFEGLIPFTNFVTLQTGPTLPTASTLPRRGIPDRETECLQAPNTGDPLVDVRPVSRKLVYAVPAAGARTYGSLEGSPSVREQWVSLKDGGMMDIPALGFLSDMYLPIPENYKQTSRTHWYPTLSLSVEVKRIPPPDGWKWLFCRIEAREIRNGRMDVMVDIYDEDRNLVAIANQLAIIVSSDRNKPKTLVSPAKL
ncbi:thioesterase-like superfamily-domain-containing protein [Morchella snyderi]|nr:thioesterase-like superfamily-domain-containing protein [Morchella snyderi]